MRTCDICGAKHQAQGFCRNHYEQARRSGKIDVIQQKGLSLAERLLKYSKPNAETGCIEWTGHTSHGYGRIVINRKSVAAHRLVWELRNGSIPDALMICHKCDNRACINPDHMFLGAHADNMADMVAKDRQAKGVNHGNSKLNESVVKSIRSDQRSHKDIAAEFGVSRSLVGQVKSDSVWRHVP